MRVILFFVMLLIIVGMLDPTVRLWCEGSALLLATLAFHLARRGKVTPDPAKSQPTKAEPPQDDVSTIVVFVGGERAKPEDEAAIELEVHRRVAAENAARPDHASMALAFCQQDGSIAVALHRAGEPQAAWVGMVGRIPVAYLPKSSLWTLADYRRAEMPVCAVVKAALAFR